jgi:F-type H+-transporting ATPase subunit delta
VRLPSKASRRYARALHDLALETGQVESARADVSALLDARLPSEELNRFLRDYRLPRSTRAEVLDELFAGRVCPLIWRFLRFLESKRRLPLLPDVCKAFQEIDDRQRGIVRGALRSAFPVEAGLVSTIEQRLAVRLAADVRLAAAPDPALLGGFCVRVRDTLYDLSLATQLRLLKRAMSRG